MDSQPSYTPPYLATVPPRRNGLEEAAFRCLNNIVKDIASRSEDNQTATQRNVLTWAIEYGLDTQDVATLFRIAAGEG